MNTIIEKIRAEIINRIDKRHLSEQAKNELVSILSFISDLEKECEKPTNIDFEQELYKHFGQVKDFTLGMQIGKYFYELGRQSKPKRGLHSSSLRKVDNPMKWMEEDAKEPTTADGLYDFMKNRSESLHFHDDFEIAAYKKGVVDGAKWQKEQDEREKHRQEWIAENDRSHLKLDSYEYIIKCALDGVTRLGSLCDDDAILDASRLCAKHIKEQMMKEAVETEVIKDYDLEKGTILSIKVEDVDKDEFYEAQNVKLIIVKED